MFPSSSLLKKSVVFERGERKESGCAASRINRSPQAGFPSQTCVLTGQKTFSSKLLDRCSPEIGGDPIAVGTCITARPPGRRRRLPASDSHRT